MRPDVLRIQFPLQGVSENYAFSDQPVMTCARALNVRALDGGSGRTRGAVRSGYERLVVNQLNGADVPVRDLLQVAFDEAGVTYTQLDENLPDIITEEWTDVSSDFSNATAIKVSDIGNVFATTQDNRLVKYNSAGKLLGQIGIPTENLTIGVRALAVDEEENVYVAASTGSSFRPSRLFRFSRADEEEFNFDWQFDLLGDEVVALVYRAGIIYTLETTPGSDMGTRLAQYAFLGSRLPQASWHRDVPTPANRLAIGPDGAVFVAFPPDASRRSPEDTNFLDPIVSWAPSDETDWQFRLWSWNQPDTELEFQNIAPPFPGAIPGRLLGDERYLEENDPPLADTVRRIMYGGPGGPFVHGTVPPTNETILTDWFHHSTAQNRPPPRYDPKGFGKKPGLKFDPTAGIIHSIFPAPLPGTSLRSSWTGSTTRKSHREEVLLDQRTNFPCFDQADTASADFPAVTWSGSFLIRFDGGGTECLLAQGLPGGMLIAVGLNGGDAATADAPLAGAQAARGNIMVQIGGVGGVGTINRYWIDGTPPDLATGTDSGGLNDVDSAIITIVCNGAGAAGTTSEIRVNGERLGNAFQWPIQRWGISGVLQSLWGNALLEDGGNPILDVMLAWAPFSGWLGPLMLFLGPAPSGTQADPPHTADMELGASGLVEKMEGYLAWWCGGRGTILVGHTYSLVPPPGAHSNNPFAERFNDERGMIGKFSPAFGATKWLEAFPSGAGYGVAVNSNGDVYTAGPRASSSSTQTASDTAVIVQKIIDQGSQADYGRQARVQITISGVPDTVGPESITLDDGAGNTAEFVAAASGINGGEISPGVYRWVCTTNAQTCGNNLLIAHSAVVDTPSPLDPLPPHNPALAIDIESDPSTFHLNDFVQLEIYVLREALNANTAIVHTNPTSAISFSNDEGTALLFAGGRPPPAGAWKFRATEAEAPTWPFMDMAVDVEDDLYVPFSSTDGDNQLQKFQAEGDGSGNGVRLIAFTLTDTVGVGARGVQLDPDTPSYGGQAVTGPEFCYIVSDDAGLSIDAAPKTIRKLRLVGTQIGKDDPIRHRYLGVAGGTIRLLAGQVSLPVTDGTDVLDSEGAFIQSTAAFGQGFFLDGQRYVFYDAATNTAKPWTAETSGEIPKRAKLIAFWDDRVLLARTAQDPHGIWGSAKGDPFDWDTQPLVTTATQAFDIVATRVGACPDIVNGLIPYDDDLLIILCDHSIWRLTGNPMQGGQLDLISDEIGGAFGRAHAKDPEGFVYFFGSRGGVYRMPPGGRPEKISRYTVDQALAEFDLTGYRVRLAWNEQDQGLDIRFVRAGATPGLIVEHWFWDKKNNGWWPDQLSIAGQQITAVEIFDGDKPDDRLVVTGHEDGFVRNRSLLATDDDGERIDALCLIGPITPGHAERDTRFDFLSLTMGDDTAEAGVRYFVSRTEELPGQPQATGRVFPGLNIPFVRRAAGLAVWVEIVSLERGYNWSFDSGSVQAVAAGRRRVRR